jgi:hypothetical protein
MLWEEVSGKNSEEASTETNIEDHSTAGSRFGEDSLQNVEGSCLQTFDSFNPNESYNIDPETSDNFICNVFLQDIEGDFEEFDEKNKIYDLNLTP